MTPPLPATHPDAPKYWMYETSGVLADAVDLYLNHRERMTQFALACLRAYCAQWIDSPAWDAHPYASAADSRALADLRLDAIAIYTLDALDDRRSELQTEERDYFLVLALLLERYEDEIYRTGLEPVESEG